jgi:hypothetical protein
VARQKQPDVIADGKARAIELAQHRLSVAKASLMTGPKKNPLRDVLPPGVTLKGFKEALGG